ncbi:probable cyclin-dependent serine/threonine-protein kinase DDB_G0278487 [Nematolebias whitei]|uniref:probable cyclin-dependent serine/threonine-protein kinase DDB_G0278487 n=1 Tax=Nematolebias whitei TaxID=451745 RepID=UPI0018995C4F|nr:probable cyclin-dependent serine/threonine-protein kinase DDB_G0278487 [Nematolebias whitei]
MERYESLGPVGEGSYGTVLKCRHRDSGRLVAIKKFLDSDQDKTVKKIALREVKLLRQLHHNNLVNLLEVWKRRHRWYLVFEFVDRTLLNDLEQNPNGLDLNTCRQYLFQVLRAADFCHQQNVIHRDIKPENILISQGGVVKLCDFGFARTIESPSEGGVYTDYVATRWYRAPELLVGDIKYGKPVDVWALGCLVIEMLTGEPLFPGDSDLDQIYHIVKCFGNLMTHHQEVFYQNPVFSGVKLPECSSTVPLRQCFPTITPPALDLAQRCLEMDPERRAQCSELLEHHLFTHDSFHIRFLDELNAKIQTEHKENSTFPKITKAPGQETGDEKTCRGKDKKQPEDKEEKVNKDKMEKTKAKQLSKFSKTNRNATESLMSTQPRTFGNKGIHNTLQNPIKIKPEKPVGAELKRELEISKSTKSLNYKSVDENETAVNLKKKNFMAVKPKQENVPPDPRKELLQNGKDLDCCGPGHEKNTMKNMSFFKPEPSQEFAKSWSNPTLKVPKRSNNSDADSQSLCSSPKTSLELDVNPKHKTSQNSSNDHNVVSVPLMLHDTKSYKTSPAAELQLVRLETDAEQRISISPNVLPQNTKTSTNSDPQISTNVPTRSSKTFPLDQSPIETSSAHNTAVLPQGTSNLKVSKMEGTSRSLLNDRELTDDRDFRSCRGSLNPVTETPEGTVLLSQTSDGSFKPSVPSFVARQNNKLVKDERFTSTIVGTAALRASDVSEKENREDLVCLSVNSSSTTNPLMKPTLKASGNTGSSEFDANPLNVHHPKPYQLQVGSFKKHTRSSVMPKTTKTTPAPNAKKKSDKTDRNNTTISRDSALIMSLDHKASTESFIVFKMDTSYLMEFDLGVPRSSTPSPPPPSSNPLLLPPSSQPLMSSLSMFGTNNPVTSDYLIQGAGFHPRNSSLRYVDKPRRYDGTHDRQAQKFTASQVSWSSTLQAPENSSISEMTQNKSHVHFPDIRSSVFPEFREKEGKHIKGAVKNQRKDKNLVSSSPPSEAQQGQNTNTTTQL